MLKILWKKGEIAPEEQVLLLFTIISYLIFDFYVKTRIGFSLRDKRLFEITEDEITRVDCIWELILLQRVPELLAYKTVSTIPDIGTFFVINY